MDARNKPLYRYPKELSDDDVASAIKSDDIVVCIDETPEIVIYPDGVTFVLDYFPVPLTGIFGKGNPLASYSTGACTNCQKVLRKSLWEKTVQKMLAEKLRTEEGESYRFEDLFGEVAQRTGYKFDMSRIKVGMSKRVVPVYNGPSSM